MSEVIYRKYRSKNFDELIGQDHVKHVLIQQIKNEDVSHAYLFSGPRGTGKTSTARLLAREVNNFSDKDLNFNLDIVEIDAASNRGIEEIRQLKESVNFAPASSKYKVYIIDEVHMLTKEAFNALLKTLEEPPSHVIFILATTEPEKVPITILSRVMRFDFKLASKEQILQKLNFILEKENREIEDLALEIIVDLGKGSFRDAESILGKVLTSLDSKKIKKDELEEVLGLASSDLVSKFVVSVLENKQQKTYQLILDIEKQGLSLRYFINQSLEYLRKLLLKKTLTGQGDFSLKSIANLINILIKVNENLKYSPIEVLALEVGLVEIFDSSTILEATNSKPSKKIDKSKPVIEHSKKIEEHKNEEREKEKGQENSNGKENTINNLPKNKSTEDSGHNLKLDDIIQSWKELLLEIKNHNSHLAAILSNAKPKRIIGDELVLSTGYAFHKKRIEDDKTRKSIMEFTSKVYGFNFFVTCEIDPKLKNQNFDDEVTIDSNEDVVEELFSE